MTHSLLGQAYRAMGRRDEAAQEAETAQKLQAASEPKLESETVGRMGCDMRKCFTWNIRRKLGMFVLLRGCCQRAGIAWSEMRPKCSTWNVLRMLGIVPLSLQ